MPKNFTPMQKCIVKAYIDTRNTQMAAEMTFHDRHSAFVRDVIRRYKQFLRDNDRPCSGAGPEERTEASVTLIALRSFPPSDPTGGCM